MLTFTVLLLFRHSLSSAHAYSRSSSTRVTISNIEPRLSKHGEIVNAHDGTVRWLRGKWYCMPHSMASVQTRRSTAASKALPTAPEAVGSSLTTTLASGAAPI